MGESGEHEVRARRKLRTRVLSKGLGIGMERWSAIDRFWKIGVSRKVSKAERIDLFGERERSESFNAL